MRLTMYHRMPSSGLPAASCCRSRTTLGAVHLARLPGTLSTVRSCKISSGQVRQQLRPSVLAQAQRGPDKGSVAALEAALAAINNILGTYNKIKGGKQGSGNKQGGASSKGSGQSSTTPSPGASKLITFSAKAASSVPVKEKLTASAGRQLAAGVSIHHNSTSHSSSLPSSSKPHHQHTQSHRNSSSDSSSGGWLGHLTGKQPAANVTKDGAELPPEALSKSLQAYLSLPLEQYSVLDPRLITRLPADVDVEAYLSNSLAEQKTRRAERRAHQQHMSQQQQQQQGLGAILEATGSSGSGSSSSTSGTSLEPKMRKLQEQSSACSSSQSVTGDAAAASGPVTTNSAATESERHAAEATAVAAAVEEPAGAFLLRVPMLDLLGVDLEPLLVVQVDIDDQRGQVKFRAHRLVIGDERFDQEFKVDLVATLSSKVTQQAVQVLHSSAEAAAGSAAAVAGASGNGQASSAGTTGSTAASAALEATVTAATAAGGLQQGVQQPSAAAATVVAEAVQSAAPGTTEAETRQQMWQRGSVLGCKVKLSMTVRLPHPLSIVPGPLLSTTAGLVAKLVMQALLPSFLELLATDYGRWASGSSTASRQALPAGSLVTAGKQQLQQ